MSKSDTRIIIEGLAALAAMLAAIALLFVFSDSISEWFFSIVSRHDCNIVLASVTINCLITGWMIARGTPKP